MLMIHTQANQIGLCMTLMMTIEDKKYELLMTYDSEEKDRTLQC